MKVFLAIVAGLLALALIATEDSEERWSETYAFIACVAGIAVLHFV